MKYIVLARDGWDPELQARFGDPDSTHELSNDEVVAILEHFGRFEIHCSGFTFEYEVWDGRHVNYDHHNKYNEPGKIAIPEGVKVIEFHNNYD